MPLPSSRIGRLSFEFETFAFGIDDRRKRPTRISGTLSSYTPFPALPPLSHFEHGDSSASHDAMEGYDKGHVIMVSHSGISSAENIVPMYPCFNQAGGIWRQLELRIASYTDLTMPSRGSPRVMEMSVDIEYTGLTDPRFPTAFRVTLTDHSDQGGFVYFNGAPLNNMRFAHLPMAPANIDAIAELGADAVAHINSAQLEMTALGWRIESIYPNARLAPLDQVPARPYAVLDYLWHVKRNEGLLEFLTDGCIYRDGHAAQFHERQKQIIRIVNAMRNGGRVKSDYPGDTNEDLIVGSGQRSAQIDHVYPYSDFGGNLFSNALIASGAYNNRMKAAPPGVKWADRGGATLYSTVRHV